MKFNHKSKGFTLLEMLLVLVIAATLLGIVLNYTTQATDQYRRNKEAIQVQQILNAALAYYIQFGIWPSNASTPTANWSTLDSTHSLLTKNFLPAGHGTSNSAWLSAYTTTFSTGYDATTGNFYVINQIPAATTTPENSLIIAGMMPLGVTAVNNGTVPPVTAASCLATGSCYVVGGVAPPGQSLANARSVNFAGIYNNGACVPAPSCPNGTVATVYVVPTAISGVAYTGSTNTSPINSFSAYAYGTANGTSTPASTPALGGTNVANCSTPATGSSCLASGPGSTAGVSPLGTISANLYYWRVCLAVQTSNGWMSATNTGSGASQWGQYATVAAFTRCVPTKEPFGSDISVFTN